MTSLNAQQSHVLRAFFAVRQPTEFHITDQGDGSVYVATDQGSFEITDTGARHIDFYDDTDWRTDRAISRKLIEWDQAGVIPGQPEAPSMMTAKTPLYR